MRRRSQLAAENSMSLKSFSCAPQIAAAIAAALLVPASGLHAQTVVRMTTTQQTSCVATTDAQGLRLVPGSADLQASGVALSGDGCGTQTAPSENFEATVNMPSAATVGTAFNIGWTAGPTATACTLGGGGPAAASGWVLGSRVCTGAACAGSHSLPVTITTAGNYSFSVTCTNSTGYATGSVAATGGTGGGPTPADFPLNGPGSANVGQAFDISWAVSGVGVTCTGAATRDGAAVTLAGWNDGVTSNISPRHVTATQQGTYSLTMRCENPQGFVNSLAKTVTVSPVVGSCPASLQESASVSYEVDFSPAAVTDVRLFDNVWGRTVVNGTIEPWPGRNFIAFLANYDKTKYISAKFRVPASGVSPTLNGAMTYSEDVPGPRITTSISTTCGEFDAADLGPGCLTENRWKGNTIAKWKLPTGSPSLVACALTPGQDYYLNIKATSPDTAMPACSGNICKLGVTNSWAN